MFLLSMATLVGALATLGYLRVCARVPAGATGDLPSEAEMRACLLWRSFYVNPADPRGWVPKFSGIGRTANFRTPDRARKFAILIAITGALGLATGAAGLAAALGA